MAGNEGIVKKCLSNYFALYRGWPFLTELGEAYPRLALLLLVRDSSLLMPNKLADAMPPSIGLHEVDYQPK